MLQTVLRPDVEILALCPHYSEEIGFRGLGFGGLS